MNPAVMVAVRLLGGASGGAIPELLIRPHSVVNASIVGKPTLQQGSSFYIPVQPSEIADYEPID